MTIFLGPFLWNGTDEGRKCKKYTKNSFNIAHFIVKYASLKLCLNGMIFHVWIKINKKIFQKKNLIHLQVGWKTSRNTLYDDINRTMKRISTLEWNTVISKQKFKNKL